MRFRCEADLQAFRIAAVAGAADVDPAGRVRDPRSGLALQRPWRIAHAAGSGPGGQARWEPGAAAARSGADEGAAEGPRRPAVAALRLLRVRRNRRACHSTDPGFPCGMPGAGRGLRAAGWRRRVGRNPGQGAGGRRARPGKADVPGEDSGRGKRTERRGDLRNVRHRARGRRERLPAGVGLFPAGHGAFGRVRPARPALRRGFGQWAQTLFGRGQIRIRQRRHSGSGRAAREPARCPPVIAMLLAHHDVETTACNAPLDCNSVHEAAEQILNRQCGVLLEVTRSEIFI